MKYQIITFFSVLLCYTTVAAQKRIYVRNNNNPIQTGETWNNAFSDFQTALQISVSGDSIWVASGIYRPTSTNARTANFNIPSGVKTFGGFSGIENSIPERNWELNKTILSGDIGVQNDSTDNSYNVVFMENPDSFTVFDGFQVKFGQADSVPPTGGSFVHWRSGGGLFIEATNGEAYPKIRNCSFKNNTAESHGGAIFINGGGIGSVAPTIEYCHFEDNTARLDGGAIYRRGSSWSDQPHDFFQSTFRKNAAYRDGGAIFFRDAERTDSLEISFCKFIKNSAGFRGPAITIGLNRSNGYIQKINNCLFDSTIVFNYDPQIGTAFIFNLVYFEISKKLEFRNSTFNNTTNKQLIYNPGSVDVELFSNCIFKSNFTSRYGLICSDIEKISVKNCVFHKTSLGLSVNQDAVLQNIKFENFDLPYLDNPDSSFYALGVNCLLNTSLSNVSFENNLQLHKNYIYLRNCQKMINCFLPNPTDTSGALKSYYISNGDCQVYNSIFEDSYLFDKNPFIFLNTTFKNCYFKKLNNNLLPQNITFGTGNIIGGSPMFRDSIAGDFTLLPCSPLINAGINTPWLNQFNPTDLAQQPRIQNNQIDIGPYENRLFFEKTATSPTSCAGSHDGSVTLAANACLPITLSWSGGTLTADSVFSGLPSGTFPVTITAANGYSELDTLTIGAGEILTYSLATSPVKCFGDSTGSASVFLLNATQPVDYQWITGDSTASISGLAAGNYTLSATDAIGCTVLAKAEITEPTARLEAALPVIAAVNCPDEMDGSLSIAVAGGTPNYQFLWSNGATGSTISGLAGGAISGTVTDANGCKDTISAVIFEPMPFSIDTQIQPASGQNTANGSIKITNISGGTAPFQLLWNTNQTTDSIGNLLPDAYFLTITDAHNCTSEWQFIVDFDSKTTENELLSNEISIFPNPASQFFNLKNASKINLTHLEITDALGKLFLEKQPISAQPISVLELPDGVYFVHFFEKNKRILTRRLVVLKK
jgi:hypothetical protein